MAFYGFIVKAGTSHEAEIPENTVFTLCNVALSANDGQKAQLFVETDGAKYLLATLTAGKVDQQALDLNFFFDEEAPTKFTVNGQGEVHLTGYLQLEDDDVDMDEFDDDMMGMENAGEEEEGEDEEDEEESVPQKVQPKKEAPKVAAAPQQAKKQQGGNGNPQGKPQGQQQGKQGGNPNQGKGQNQNNQQKRPNASPNDAQNKKQKTNTPGKKQ